MPSSLLHTEIYEQPAATQRLLDSQTGPVQAMADNLRGRFDGLLIAARGTSDNAARYAQYLFGAYNRLPVALATPSLFTLYDQPPLLKRLLVTGISQSGQSPDIVAVLSEAHRQGQPTLAITNDPHSPLAQAADYIIALQAGPERAVAATKTYTTSLAALALFSIALAEDPARLAELQRMPECMQATLDGLAPLLERVERYRYMDRCAVVGRGFNYATAFEIALKVKELTGVVAESYSSADFRHGPIAIVRNGFPVVVVAPQGIVYGDMAELITSLRQLDAELVLVSNQPDLFKLANLALPIPGGVPEWLTPLLAVIPGQCFALTLTLVKGYDPDRPKGLTKVTETF
jgi:glucosamine--fructose-6-phosphate aminotransferase (isomerizing)